MKLPLNGVRRAKCELFFCICLFISSSCWCIYSSSPTTTSCYENILICLCVYLRVGCILSLWCMCLECMLSCMHDLSSCFIEPPYMLFFCLHSCNRAATMLPYKANNTAITKYKTTGSACSAFSRKITQRANARVLQTKCKKIYKRKIHKDKIHIDKK